MSKVTVKQIYKGLELHNKGDGHWLRFKSSSNLSAVLCLENIGGAIVSAALVDWANDTLEDNVVVMDTEEPVQDEKSIATTLYFLAAGIDRLFSALDLENGYDDFFVGNFGGHDGFVHELYWYAKELDAAWDRKDEELHANGVFDYEVSEELAAQMFMNLTIDRRDRWPECCDRLIQIWCESGCVNASNYVEDQKQSRTGGAI